MKENVFESRRKTAEQRSRRNTAEPKFVKDNLENAFIKALLVIKFYSFSISKKASQRLPIQRKNGEHTDEYMVAQFLRGAISLKKDSERQLKNHGVLYHEVEKVFDSWSEKIGFLNFSKPKMRHLTLPSLKTEAQISSLVDGVLGQDWKTKFPKVKSMLDTWEDVIKPEISFEVLIAKQEDPLPEVLVPEDVNPFFDDLAPEEEGEEDFSIPNDFSIL